MNSDESELEAELRTLRPCAASPALEDRLAAVLRGPDTTLRERPRTSAVLPPAPGAAAGAARWWQGWGWAAAGAAATALIFASLRSGDAPAAPKVAETAATASPTEEFEHTGSTEALVATEDEGLMLGTDEEPLRQVHSYSIERHVWTNAHTGARMEFEIPREDVRFMPVAMQ
jgi:hypothetical protein